MDADATRTTLLSRVRDPSDTTAWREFEARYGELLVRYARARGLQHCDAEDVRQVVLLNLSKSLRGFQYCPERGRFRDYLGRIVQNVVNQVRARHDPATVALDSNVLGSVPADPESSNDALWEQEWMDGHYRLALDTLRRTFEPRSVEIFERLVAGEDPAAVAVAYDLTGPALRKVKQRIRTRMNALIAAQIREEDAPDG